MRVFVLCFSESGASIWVGEKPLALASLWSNLMKFLIVSRSEFSRPLIYRLNHEFLSVNDYRRLHSPRD